MAGTNLGIFPKQIPLPRVFVCIIGWIFLITVGLAQTPSEQRAIDGTAFDEIGFGGELSPIIEGEDVLPPVLRDSLATPWELPRADEFFDSGVLQSYARDAPTGFSGPSGIKPTERHSSDHFVPVEDRWRIGFPEWDRYGKGHPPIDDYPYVNGAWWDPYNQNVLKGDYPLIGQHTFFRVTLRSLSLFEGRQVPTPTTPFEATRNPGQAEFFGDPDQYFFSQNDSASFELIHGDGAFKPADWRFKIDLVYNMNHLVADELAIVTPDVRDGTSRFRQYLSVNEVFGETKLMDIGPMYDFASLRVGSQLFTSDFRGFIFSDTNRAVRLFGTRDSNRDQFNAIFFDQAEKDTNSLLNTSQDRDQNVFILNYMRQDFLFPGYTAQISFHYNHDQPSTEFDRNRFLVRPDPVGIFQPHDIRSYYLGWTGNGHIERINVSNAAYYVFGRDNLNPLAGMRQEIDAYMNALELSYDRDWIRFRTSYFFASGDSNIYDDKAQGFDAILPNPAFAGGEFSYWNRQALRLFGVELTNRLSLTPSLRSSKFQGQSNFVNPGLQLFNFGIDSDWTQRFRTVANCNFLWFNRTDPLEQYLFVGQIRNYIGADLSLGAEYRPMLNNNMLLLGGISTLRAGEGYRDLFQTLSGKVTSPVAGFLEVSFEY